MEFTAGSEAVGAFRRAADIAREQGRSMDLIVALHNAVTCQVLAGNRWADDDLDELIEPATLANNARASAIAQPAMGVTALVR